MTRHIYISTGELSGEQHAARLAVSLREAEPDIRLTGMGTDVLRSAGVDTVVDADAIRVMGFVEVLTHLPAIHRAFKNALAHIERERPDAVVLVDYPGFHLRLARAIRERMPDVKIFGYIAPKAWAWNERRTKTIARCMDRLFCIFPFEKKWFGMRGVNAAYVGNPTVDAVRDAPDGAALRDELNLAQSDICVGLLPGSRRSELKRLLPPMLDAAARLRAQDERRRRFLLAVAPGFRREDLSGIATLPEWVTPIENRPYEVMRASDLLLAKSGTTTLEAALLDTPMVVMYKANPVTAWIARGVLSVPFVSLPNILSGREVVPELLQECATGDLIATTAQDILSSSTRQDSMHAAFAELRESLGDEPAADRAAREVLSAIASG